jgi:phosphate-selective porin OprO/OprP
MHVRSAWAVVVAFTVLMTQLFGDAPRCYCQAPADAGQPGVQGSTDFDCLRSDFSAQAVQVPGSLASRDDHGTPPAPQPASVSIYRPGEERPAPRHEDAKEAEPEKKSFELQASWTEGLQFKSGDDQFHIHVGGNAQIDSTWIIGPKSAFDIPGGGMNGVENASATFIRRARLRVEGDIFDQFDFVVEYDFANADNENSGQQPPSFGNLNGAPAPANVWMQIRDVPYLGNVRIGNQIKPIGMTNNTYQGFLPFMERPDNQDAFYAPFDKGFVVGVSSRSWSESERMTWQYGIYRPLIDPFGVALNKGAVGARVTGLPVYDDGGESLIHLGFGTYDSELVQNEVRDRARTILRNAPGYAVPILVDTSEIPGSRQYIFAPEFAMVLGPLTIQAEWAGQFVTDAHASNGQLQGTVFFHGGYVETLYFLTGEHQEYVKREGVFGRVIPIDDYHLKKCDNFRSFGAWQVGVRFSYLDLNDKAIQGGRVYDWTAGLNWFLNPNMKIQLNYILEHRDAPQGIVQAWINGVGVRAAYDF